MWAEARLGLQNYKASLALLTSYQSQSHGHKVVQMWYPELHPEGRKARGESAGDKSRDADVVAGEY